MSGQAQIDTVTEIMEATRVAVLTYRDERGRLVSTPMGVQDMKDPGTVHFITEKDSAKVRCIQQAPEVNVAYASDKGWVSLSGTAALVEDRQKLAELWETFTDSYMEGGPEHPNSGLLEITGDTAEYWESPGGLMTMVKLVGAKVTGSKTDLGDNEIVDLQ